MSMESNLPATSSETALTERMDAPAEPPPRSQPLSVAFLPLALVVFILLAFIIATWTFLAAGG
jgi:hypothetical protein